MVAMSLLLWPVAGTGWIYPAAAAALGGAFLVEAHRLHGLAGRGVSGVALRPMRLFHWSNTYLALLFVAVALDAVLR
jgi:protoheme IX farnesyltransferase